MPRTTVSRNSTCITCLSSPPQNPQNPQTHNDASPRLIANLPRPRLRHWRCGPRNPMADFPGVQGSNGRAEAFTVCQSGVKVGQRPAVLGHVCLQISCLRPSPASRQSLFWGPVAEHPMSQGSQGTCIHQHTACHKRCHSCEEIDPVDFHRLLPRKEPAPGLGVTTGLRVACGCYSFVELPGGSGRPKGTCQHGTTGLFKFRP